MVRQRLVSSGLCAAARSFSLDLAEGLGLDAVAMAIESHKSVTRAMRTEGDSRKMTKFTTLLFSCALALATVGCGSSCGNSQPSTGASADSSSGDIASSTTNGSARSVPSDIDDSKGDVLSVLSVEHQLDVTAQRDGMVVSVAKDQGATVTRGEILANLDDRTLQVDLIKARDDLQVAQNNVKYKEAEGKAKTAALQRQQQLRSLGLSSQADLEQADFEARAAEYDMPGWEA